MNCVTIKYVDVICVIVNYANIKCVCVKSVNVICIYVICYKNVSMLDVYWENCLCENAYTLTSCPGKQRIFIVVCPKFFQVFDAFDFTVLCQVRINSIPIDDQNESVVFISGFFIDINNILVCASNGYAYLYLLPDR